MEKFSYVYMMNSTSRRALYTGVTAPLYFRVWQHKNNQGGYFTSKYKCYRLVYFEQFTNVEVAIAREKEIKGWRREKKDRLVESMNPGWKDLAGTHERRGSDRLEQIKHKVPQGYSPADESAGLTYALRDDVFSHGTQRCVLKRQIDPKTQGWKKSNFPRIPYFKCIFPAFDSS